MKDTLFSELKVVEFASVLAGPAVGMFFAELGAKVIKIENKTTKGDITRGWKLPNEDPASAISAYFCSVNWGKQHIFLDLREPTDKALALQYTDTADIVITNFKPSSARRLGLDADTLRARNSKLIYAHISGWANSEDERPAFDVVLQAETGFLSMTGEPSRSPVKMPVALIDLLAAHQLKEAILAALWRRERTGRGCEVSVSLWESAIASLANQATNWLMVKHLPQRMGMQHPNIAPYGDLYTCADGQQLLLAVGTEQQFENLCRCLSVPQLLKNPIFQTNAARVKHRHVLNELLQAIFSQRNLCDWLDVLHAHNVPCAQIRNLAAVFESPEAKALLLEETLPDGTLTQRVSTAVFRLRE
ncbi:MAG: CoA transferase [Saprospiraceae bacterium]|nr:CoA transferase [Saprospiraceae bacterium]MDW8484630.1 CoA transferase [Saprospiraceae bacterium]